MARHTYGRRIAFISGLVAVGLGLGTLARAADTSRSATKKSEPASVVFEADVFGAFPSVSDDGRFVVYEGLPTDESGRERTVWLRDASSPGQVDVELTTVPADVPMGNSFRPVISGDGCVVAVITEMAFDLFRDDSIGDRYDVYSITLPQCDGELGKWQLVSSQSSSDGDTSALDRVVPTEAPSISQTGSVIAFTHRARPGRDTLLAASVVDRSIALGVQGRITEVAGTPILAPNTTFLYRGVRQPDVSADGRFVVFTSDADSTESVAEWGTGPVAGGFATSQVFVWDRGSAPGDPTVTLVSAVASAASEAGTADVAGASEGADSPVISGNGQYVAFESSSADLAGTALLPECRATCPTQIYRFDRATGTIVLVTRQNTAEGRQFIAADLGGSEASVSDDGSQVGFVTRSRNLFPTVSIASTEASDGDIVVSEVDLGAVRRVSTLADGVTAAPAVNSHPALSGPGHVVVFDTLAADSFAAGQTTGRRVVAVDRSPQLSVATLDVGTVAVGYPGPEWYVAIRNEGPSTFMPATVESSLPDFAVTGGTCGLGLPVPPGQSCTVYVVLTPSIANLIKAEITVAETIFGGTTVTSGLIGAGGEPALRNTAGEGSYAATAVGSLSTPVSFEIANIGFAPATIARSLLTGADPADFDITSDSCTGYLLNPGATCSVEAVFAPTAPGYRSATLLVSTALNQYASAILVGDGTREATLDVSDDNVRAGDGVALGGSGFKPYTQITLSWADGRGLTTTVSASAEGSFLAILDTKPNEKAGDRVVVAQSIDAVAKVDVQITRRPRANTVPGFGG